MKPANNPNYSQVYLSGISRGENDQQGMTNIDSKNSCLQKDTKVHVRFKSITYSLRQRLSALKWHASHHKREHTRQTTG